MIFNDRPAPGVYFHFPGLTDQPERIEAHSGQLCNGLDRQRSFDLHVECLRGMVRQDGIASPCAHQSSHFDERLIGAEEWFYPGPVIKGAVDAMGCFA